MGGTRLNWLHREGSSAIAKPAKLLRGDQTQAVERSDINGERSTRSSETKKREKRYKREREVPNDSLTRFSFSDGEEDLDSTLKK